MRVIMIGPPGAGKGVQCDRLARRVGVPHLSSGDMLRAAARASTPTATELARIMADGHLIPDASIIRILRRRLAMPDCVPGFVLDGFPRTLPQALALGQALIQDSVHLDGVVLLDVPDEVALDRMIGRRVDEKTGQTYHIEHLPPSPEAAGRLVRRDDDQPSAARQQLAIWREVTDRVADLYRERDMLWTVDGTGTPSAVHARVSAALELP